MDNTFGYSNSGLTQSLNGITSIIDGSGASISDGNAIFIDTTTNTITVNNILTIPLSSIITLYGNIFLPDYNVTLTPSDISGIGNLSGLTTRVTNLETNTTDIFYDTFTSTTYINGNSIFGTSGALATYTTMTINSDIILPSTVNIKQGSITTPTTNLKNLPYLDATSSIQTQINNITSSYAKLSNTNAFSNNIYIYKNIYVDDALFNSINYMQFSLIADGTSSGHNSVVGIDFTTWSLRGAASARIYGLDNNNYSGHLVFSTAPGGSSIFPSTERMRIQDNGNIGIGKTNPSYLLDINGSMNATTINENGTLISSKYATITSLSNYLTTSTASSTYLTQTNASSTYGKLASSNTWTQSNTFSSGIIGNVDNTATTTSTLYNSLTTGSINIGGSLTTGNIKIGTSTQTGSIQIGSLNNTTSIAGNIVSIGYLSTNSISLLGAVNINGSFTCSSGTTISTDKLLGSIDGISSTSYSIYPSVSSGAIDIGTGLTTGIMRIGSNGNTSSNFQIFGTTSGTTSLFSNVSSGTINIGSINQTGKITYYGSTTNDTKLFPNTTSGSIYIGSDTQTSVTTIYGGVQFQNGTGTPYAPFSQIVYTFTQPIVITSPVHTLQHYIICNFTTAGYVYAPTPSSLYLSYEIVIRNIGTAAALVATNPLSSVFLNLSNAVVNTLSGSNAIRIVCIYTGSTYYWAQI